MRTNLRSQDFPEILDLRHNIEPWWLRDTVESRFKDRPVTSYGGVHVGIFL